MSELGRYVRSFCQGRTFLKRRLVQDSTGRVQTIVRQRDRPWTRCSVAGWQLSADAECLPETGSYSSASQYVLRALTVQSFPRPHGWIRFQEGQMRCAQFKRLTK
ncbi:hypothetical protein Mapa_010981 [Marchantia paleacea]|nr:hypothetical protein Mapa_010981 [Marchantia paleacea]